MSQATDHIGGAEKILKENPTDLGYTNLSDWLQFPPAEHPDWEFDGIVAGVGVDSQENVYISHRGNSAPRLTVWKAKSTRCCKTIGIEDLSIIASN